MKLHPDQIGSDQTSIDAYSPGQITVNQVVYTASLILSPNQVDSSWPPSSLDELEAHHIRRLMELDPEIIILGSGNKFQLLKPELTKTLVNAGIGYEVMDTAAACRTFNVLISEGRVVVAGLLINEN